MVFDLIFWYWTMKVSIEAIHYVDPYWNEVGSGLLWPAIAYLFGLDKKINDPVSTKKHDNKNEIADFAAMQLSLDI